MPRSTFYQVADEVGAEYNPYSGLYEFDCSVLESDRLPSLEFTIGGKQYLVTSHNYVLKLSFGNDQYSCVFGATPMDASGFGPSLILGDVFIRSFCNVYDVGHNRIGFADLKVN
ncbi:unnamed protein product [Gongylonema pulchrum]|uniref:Peptidase A1 domain-containing protein n=1 Tax=Gongylonema pulchrum TaxID=637853 RepID=A0A183DYK9_9BILA|nr:unnamed protein product [Gongylonema pulchrum]